uniref:Uncharacterized protein n=1 Tax=Rhizophagus irregularis (strain DAOM 181602 / DAOM 197198 / MUCL 43194) TaxID=747089 RepID=U9T599_RHIID
MCIQCYIAKQYTRHFYSRTESLEFPTLRSILAAVHILYQFTSFASFFITVAHIDRGSPTQRVVWKAHRLLSLYLSFVPMNKCANLIVPSLETKYVTNIVFHTFASSDFVFYNKRLALFRLAQSIITDFNEQFVDS